MPLYEYQCECGKEKDILLSFQEADLPQICECGKVMRKKMSLGSFAIKQYGGQMALDTLNSGVVGGKRKAWAENMAAQGL